MIDKKPILAYALIMDLADIVAGELVKMKRLWECEVDGDWSVIVNATWKPIHKLEPFHCKVLHRGFPVAELNPYSGSFLDIAGCEEDDFITAIEAAIKLAKKEVK